MLQAVTILSRIVKCLYKSKKELIFMLSVQGKYMHDIKMPKVFFFKWVEIQTAARIP